MTVNLPDEVGPDFDVESAIEEFRDCDTLSDTFIAVVRGAVEDLDEVSDATGGRIPAPQLSEKVDAVVDNAYFEIAERLGCNAVGRRIEMIDRLRNLDPESEAGDDLVTEVIRQLEEAG